MSNREQLLEEAGWTIECESPLEIRHEEGSFATGLAALTVISELEQASVHEARYRVLRTIEGAASLARHTGDATNKQLWQQVLDAAKEVL